MTSVYQACLLVLASILLGCSGGTDVPYAQMIGNPLREPSPAPEDVSKLTPQWIAALTTPALEVTLERSGRVAVLSPFSDRRDSAGGAVRIWRSADGAQIVLRGGVLIATRGLGNDVDSTLAQTMIAALSARAPVSGHHVLYTVTSENSTKAVDLSCQSKLIEDDVIDIAGRQIETRQVRVTCRWGAETKVYDFWVDAGGSTVRQSRQWAGPDLGYIRTRLLNE